MKSINCFLILLFLALATHGQQKQFDNMSFLQTKAANDANYYLKLAELTARANLDSSFYYASKAVSLATEQEQAIIPAAEYFIAAYYVQTGKFDSGLLLTQKNLALLKNTNNKHTLLVDYSNLLGHYYMRMNRQKDALESYYYSLKVADVVSDPLYRLKANTNIGWALMELNQYEKAIVQFKQSVHLMNTLRLKKFATVYTNLASCYGELRQYDSAKKYVQIGIDVARQNKDLTALANGLNILGTVYQWSEQYAEALKVCLEAKETRIKIGDPFYIVSDMAVVAGLYAKTGQPGAGLAMVEEALTIAKQNNLDAKLPMLYQALAANYEAAGDYKMAAETYKTINALKDTVYTNANSKALAEMQTRYETEKKERQIQLQKFELEKKNYWLVGITCILLLGALLGYSFHRRKKLQQEQRMQSAIIRQQDMATRAILEAEEAERQRIAKDLHDGVGQMMSAAKMNLSAMESRLSLQTEDQKAAFQNIIGLVDESCKEVRSVSHNMMPNALLKGSLAAAIQEFIDKLDQTALKVHLYTEGLDSRLDASIETVLYRIIQECVNNVIKHAGANTLDISIINDNQEITATIEDNGKGFDISDKEKAEGIGLKNMRSRIEYLKGSIDFDSSPGRGTVVALHVPLA